MAGPRSTTRKSGVLGSIPGLATYFRFSFRFFKKGSYWRKYVHEVLVNRLGGLSLPRKSVVRLTDRPDMTLDVYRGRKTTTQQQQPVQMNGSIGEWFRTTVGVRQGCLLSPTLFNIFLERIMSDAQEEHVGKVSIGGRNITNLRFADDIDALAEEEQELEALVESLHKTFTRYKMKISAEKTKLMTNSANGVQSERDKGTRAFKYHGAVVSDQRFSQGLHKPLQLLQS